MTLGVIERKDPAFDAIIPKDAMIEILAGGFDWSEGPVWVPEKDGGHVLFSDIPKNMIWKWSEKDGLKPFLKPSGYTGTAAFTGKEPGSNGLAVDSAGNLLLCQHGDRVVSRLPGIDPKGKRQIICRGAKIPAGWVLVDDLRDSGQCDGGNAAAVRQYNVWAVEQYEGRASGTVITVCAATATPEGWSMVDVYRNRELCGHPDELFGLNVKRIRKN